MGACHFWAKSDRHPEAKSDRHFLGKSDRHPEAKSDRHQLAPIGTNSIGQGIPCPFCGIMGLCYRVKKEEN